MKNKTIMSFIQLLFPDVFVQKVQDVNLEKLVQRGYDTIIFDLDNTLLGWRSKNFSDEVMNWINEARKQNFKMCIVSNSLFKGRVNSLSKKVGLPAFFRAVKPSSKSFLQAIEFLRSEKNKTVIIGDQIFTDILGGNRTGLYTILVKPVEPREFFITFFQRMGEKIVLYLFKNNKKKQQGNIKF